MIKAARPPNRERSCRISGTRDEMQHILYYQQETMLHGRTVEPYRGGDGLNRPERSPTEAVGYYSLWIPTQPNPIVEHGAQSSHTSLSDIQILKDSNINFRLHKSTSRCTRREGQILFDICLILLQFWKFAISVFEYFSALLNSEACIKKQSGEYFWPVYSAYFTWHGLNRHDASSQQIKFLNSGIFLLTFQYNLIY